MGAPEWRRVADDLSERIDNKEFDPGSRLPSLPELKAHYGLGQSTIQRALAILTDRGKVQYRPGRGYYLPAVGSETS